MTGNNLEKKKQSRKMNLTRIVNDCAFMLGFVSWVCTSYGLKNFLHLPDWQAFMISFVVQSLLVFMGIKLPTFFKKDQDQIQTNTPANGIWEKIRWHRKKIASILFYLILVIISSSFAYVFMVNHAYSMTWHIDANSIVSSQYQSTLYVVQDYINQRLSINERNISSSLAHLQTQIQGLPEGATESTGNYHQLQSDLIDLESKLSEATERKEDVARNLENATDRMNKALESYGAALNPTLWTRSSTRNENVEQTKNILDSCQTDVELIQSEQKQVGNEIKDLNDRIRDTRAQMENSQVAFDNEIHSILKELAKDEPELEQYDRTAQNILDIIFVSSGTTYKSDSFVGLIEEIQIFRRLLKEHSSLQKAQLSIGSMIERQERPVSIPGSTIQESEIEKWQTYWHERIDLLNADLRALPVYVKYDDTDDPATQQLGKMDPGVWSKKLDSLRRNMVGSVNPLERAFQLLSGEYNTLAIITLILAVLIDTLPFFAGMFNIAYKKGQDTRAVVEPVLALK